MTYESCGNIASKSDLSPGIYTYGHATKPFAVTGINSGNEAIPSADQVATYTSFEQVSTIEEDDYYATFTYNSDNQRCKMLITDLGSTILTRWYVGSRYIKETDESTTTEYTWIGGDAYSAPIIAETVGSTTSYYYLLRDYLGNITHKVNTSNTVTAEYSYDAWGRRRDKDDWSYTLSGEPDLTAGRGFTSHEYLACFNIVNMNGRLYDPLVGRFLSPDPFLQAPDLTQSYNRYSYCLNNPLLYVDYSGYTWFKDIGKWISKNWQPIVTVVATVAVVAAVTVITAGLGTGPLVAGMAIGAAGGFTSGAVGTWVNKGGFWEGIGAGAINGAIGAVGGLAGGAAAGWAAKSVGSFAINGLGIAHRSAIGGFIAGSVGGAAGGAVSGFATGLLTGDIENAWKMAGQGALFGAVAGGIVGGIKGFKSAKMLGKDPWTGNAKPIPNTRNGHLAGGVHPKTGVPFDSDGFPNFKENLYKNGPNDVRIKPTGNRLGDINAANNAAGYQSTPKGYTWHHHQTTGRMQLVESLTHMKTGHTGGFSIWKF